MYSNDTTLDPHPLDIEQCRLFPSGQWGSLGGRARLDSIRCLPVYARPATQAGAIPHHCEPSWVKPTRRNPLTTVRGSPNQKPHESTQTVVGASPVGKMSTHVPDLYPDGLWLSPPSPTLQGRRNEHGATHRLTMTGQ